MRKTDNSKRGNFNRRKFLGNSLALAGGIAAGSLATPMVVRAKEKITWARTITAGLNGKEGDPTDISIRLIPEILKDKHNIEIDLKIYPSSQLAADLGQIEGVQNGLMDIASNATASFNGSTDAYHFMDLPFLFPSWDKALAFAKNDFMKSRNARAESQMPLKILPLVGGGGFRIITNKARQVKTPADFSGLKLRSSFGGSIIDQNTIRSWGGAPTPLPWGESYSGVQTGIIDGMFVQPIWTYLAKFAEILSHGTTVPSNWVGQLQVMNIDTWKEMPDNIKGPFMEAAQTAADEGNRLDRQLEGEYIKKLAEAGMAIYNPTEAEMKLWRDPAVATWDNSGLDPELIAAVKKVAG